MSTGPFISVNCMGNVHEGVSFVNSQPFADRLFQIVPISGGSACIVIYKEGDRTEHRIMREYFGIRQQDYT